MNTQKYQGIIPAFYAAYDKEGNINTKAVEELAIYLADKGVRGLYVGGSSGECIYQSVEERKLILEHVMKALEGRDVTVIAHVACNNTKDSKELAAHAEKLGVDAIASIPPIYFKLPEYAIAEYWNDMSKAAPNTDFIIYNIPQLAGIALTPSLVDEMLKNPKVIGIKNSSMPVQDIQMWVDKGCITFNGPDEQLLSGLAAGAVGGIGGTYAVMPELYNEIFKLYHLGEMETARKIQNDCCNIIYKMCSAKGNLYAIMKEVLRLQGGPDLGGVREPLFNMVETDKTIAKEAYDMIEKAKKEYIK